MARRELSNTLKNLKFMQKTARREEKTEKEEEVKPAGNFVAVGAVKRKCVVIMEGDPQPGAIIGRMSFQSFNPSIDKLNEQASNIHQPEASATCSNNQTGKNPLRENGILEDGEYSEADKLDPEANGDHKRKQSDVVSEPQYPKKSPKNVQAGQQSSPSNHKGSFKQPKHEKLDWNVLRPPKFPNKNGERN
ncbi:hypothetical protein ACOSP7_024889 [Xanthoceras sorbifolium]|uniref:M-phase phosphoprotein 6 n=1 Tax=Xanthoceras sorbifolium TaxID=99658 RepID=A0ABQ8GXD8_9ROSI|nr:hypothetical protein JRO89_XSUnG0190800 [Xanthoceras sorbifolium]